ncbi:hypothetical protein SAMN04490243_1940 [Robiginitalea myxolifaciens]|uniref:LVIVD repeat-containing protein n=1 Tax=Robiginitalea myxolifaciens TaxID=400055 RepID=A0A1I6GZD1_9FLAO|nr:hypothetical protein [Robiginitalea myxolifaciens]SFR47556.1 hypothetical protein SAMN04490243_1940 [Robiginitalea myxolifaciens]
MVKLAKLTWIFPVLFIVGCSDQTTVFQDDLEDDLILNTNQSILDQSVSFSQAGVLDIYEEGFLSNRSNDEAGQYPLTLIASVAPPSSTAGDNLTASHVDLSGDYVYVGYNTVGSTYKGAIDVVDISDPHNPRVRSRLIYTNADINALKYNNGYVYIVGGVDSETSVRATSNSFIARIAVNSGRMSTTGILYGFQQGFNATDLLFKDGNVLVSSGKEGSITAYNAGTLEIVNEAYSEDVRSMAATSNGLAVLDAGTGVRVLDANLVETGMIPVSTDLGVATKKTIEVKDNSVLVSEAERGVGVYDLNNGNLMEYLEIPVRPEGVDAADVVTNAVSSNEEAIFMANGGAGLSLSQEENGTSQTVGIIELNGSVNYVVSRGDYAFAATGEGGLQIIKLNRPSSSLEGACQNLPEYRSSSRLTVNAGENEAYSGSRRLRNISVAGELLLCGSWTVRDGIILEPDGVLQVYGNMTVARNSRRRDVVVAAGARLVVEGNFTLFGDLTLEDGATLEFLGDASTIDVFGDVEINGSAQVLGTFRDVRDKF